MSHPDLTLRANAGVFGRSPARRLTIVVILVIVCSLSSVPAQVSASAKIGSWSSGHRVDDYDGEGDGYLPEVSCLNKSLCFATFSDGTIAGLVDGEWTPAMHRFAHFDFGSLTFVTCSAAVTCMGMDSSGDMVGNKKFMPTSSPPRSNDLSALACPSTFFCVAVTLSGTALTYSRGKWSGPSLIDPLSKKNTGLSAISCPSETFCVAVDSMGAVLQYRNGTWSPPDRIDPQSSANYGLGFVSLACSSSKFCMAIDSDGYEYSYVNGSWSKRIAFDRANGDTASVSCPSRNFCVSVDNNGDAIYFVDGKWQSPIVIDPRSLIPGDELSSVSCPSRYFCEAVDNNGYAFKYEN